MKNKIAFSQSAFEDIAKLDAPEPVYWDTEFGRGLGAFGLQVYGDGDGRLFVQTRVGGKQTKPTIVTKRPLRNLLSEDGGIDNVRKKARETVTTMKEQGTTAKVARIRDARAEKRRTTAASAELMTIDQVAEAYLAHRDETNPYTPNRRGEFEKLIWGKLVNQKDRSAGRLGGADVVWKDKPVVELDQDDGQKLVAHIRNTTRDNKRQVTMGATGDQSAIAAKRMLGPMFKWFTRKHKLAAVWDHREVFPTGKGGVMPSAPKAKDAGLSFKEIDLFLAACDEYAEMDTVGQHNSHEAAMCLKLIYYTCCRPQEAFTVRWRDFDLDCEKPYWRLEREHRKQRTVHELKLVPGAVDALRKLRAAKKPNDLDSYVFPARGKGPAGQGRKTGGGQHRGSIAGAFKTVMEIAGITRGPTQVQLTPGILRKSRINYLVDVAGLSFAEVKGQTGQDIQTIQRHYIRQGDEDAAMAKAAAADERAA